MGLYDTVRFVCPHCASRTEVQTKAGECRLKSYPQNKVPLRLAAALQAQPAEVTACCGKPVYFTAPYLPKFVEVFAEIPQDLEDE